MNKVEMTLKEVYDTVLLDIKDEYRCAMSAIYRSGIDFKELSRFADKLTRYLMGCLE